MLKLDQDQTKHLVTLHGWSGISLGLLLYAVLVTGMVAVFAEEIAHWSAGIVKQDNPLVPVAGDATPLQDTIDRLAVGVDPEYMQEVALSRTTLGNLEVFFHKHQTNADGQIEEIGTQFEIDPETGKVLSERDGTGLSLFQTDEDRALSRFLVSVHTELHLPRPWGLILTGILGLAMMIAAVSGLLVHRHLIKDLFTLRKRGSQDVLAIKDAHTVAGSWGLPFAFVLAFTGSFFSFAGSIGLPLMAMVEFKGDQEAMFSALIGSQAPEDATPQRGAAVDTMLRDVKARTGQVPDFVVVEHFRRADASANFFLPTREDGLTNDTLVYNGATGTFLKNKPPLGQEHSVGSGLFSLMGPLHFGHFLGVVSKAIWFALGFAMCYVSVTGIQMWFARRERDMPALNWAFSLVTFGLPLALFGSAVGFFLAYGRGSASFWTPVSFLIASALVIGYGLWQRAPARLNAQLRLVTAYLCVTMVGLRLATGGAGWLEALQAGQPIIITIDLLLLCAGATLWLRHRKAQLDLPSAATPTPREARA